MVMPMLLNIQNIYKNYGKEPMIVPVLKDVSLEVVQGDYIAIMGPSGSGKTTLMNIIGCLDRASLGTYLFEDEDISEMNDDALSDLRLNKIGFVFQNFNLLSSETAQENVALPLIYAGIDKEKRNQRAIDVYKIVFHLSQANYLVDKNSVLRLLAPLSIIQKSYLPMSLQEHLIKQAENKLWNYLNP